MMMPGGWDTPEVARAQRVLVELQLEHPQQVGPFKAFLEAMKHVAVVDGSFLDLGCGVGHYGVLLAREFPQLRYTGYDASAAMIREARDLYPAGRFRVRPFEQANLEAHDIVMAAQVLEYQADPWHALAWLLGHTGWTILHRLRLAGGRSHWIEDEPTYCGHRANNYAWSLVDVTNLIEAMGGCIVFGQTWERHATLVVRR